jgi:hypothetical protein
MKNFEKLKFFLLKPVSKKQIILIFLFLIFFSFLFLSLKTQKTFVVSNKETEKLFKEKKETKNPSPFSGIYCKDNKKRAIGVIFAQYLQTIPLSGISGADLVVEWPVAERGGVTRLLGIFQCNQPKEVGSIRSIRPYIVDIAFGFDSVLVSWGGALSAIRRVENLNVDWLDGRVNPGGAFFRKSSKMVPHNGFASFSGIWQAMEKLNIRKENNFEGYKFLKLTEVKNKLVDQVININYYYPVKYIYDKKTGNYLRYWNGREFLDFLTKKQVFAKNVVLLKTEITTISPGVADAKIIGQGQAKIYQMGEIIEAIWKKDSPSGKLYFLDKEGKEIKFVPGPIWIEIVDEF